jgi:hypothetical protein
LGAERPSLKLALMTISLCLSQSKASTAKSAENLVGSGAYDSNTLDFELGNLRHRADLSNSGQAGKWHC